MNKIESHYLVCIDHNCGKIFCVARREYQNKIISLKKERELIVKALDIGFEALQYYYMVEDKPGNFDFIATKAVKEIDKIMDSLE